MWQCPSAWNISNTFHGEVTENNENLAHYFKMILRVSMRSVRPPMKVMG